MKILFDHPWPFALAHGGLQIQIEQSKAALERRGLEVEHVRWWDERQSGDLIHYFGRPSVDYINFAQAKGMKVIVNELLTGLGSRPASVRLLQKGLIRVSERLLPKVFLNRMGWGAYQRADAFVAQTSWEAYLMQTMFNADPAKTVVIPNGVEEIFFQTDPVVSRKPKSDYLVCTATIDPRKRVLELAEAAALAGVPVWIIGKPYSESNRYYLNFREVQKKHPELIRYEGGISDRARLAAIYQEARGFVLLSDRESLSLSALEAAAAGSPYLLSDLPWAKCVFGASAVYAPVTALQERLAHILRDFYEKAPTLRPDFRPCTWDEIGEQLELCYRSRK
jgi:glycosyltransferase involved in cell wall biosynthesis